MAPSDGRAYSINSMDEKKEKTRCEAISNLRMLYGLCPETRSL